MNVDPTDGTTGDLPGLSPSERALLKKMFSSPLDIPQEWLAWLISYIEAHPPQFTAGSIFGLRSSRMTIAEFQAITNPFDGQTVTITDVDTDKEWNVRYDGVSANWKVVYGDPIFARFDGAENPGLSSSVWGAYANGPSKTVELGGEYHVALGGRGTGNTSATSSRTGLSLGGVTPTTYVTYAWSDSANSQTEQSPVSIAAGTLVKLYHQDSDATRRISVADRWFKLTPIRISI